MPEWLIAEVLVDSEDIVRGFGVQIVLLIFEVDIRRLPDVLYLERDKRLDIAVKSRLRWCHGCQVREHFRQDYTQSEHPNFEMEVARKDEEAAKAMSEIGSTYVV